MLIHVVFAPFDYELREGMGGIWFYTPLYL